MRKHMPSWTSSQQFGCSQAIPQVRQRGRKAGGQCRDPFLAPYLLLFWKLHHSYQILVSRGAWHSPRADSEQYLLGLSVTRQHCNRSHQPRIGAPWPAYNRPGATKQSSHCHATVCGLQKRGSVVQEVWEMLCRLPVSGKFKMYLRILKALGLH